MPGTITPAMRAPLDGETTRLATIWRIMRADGKAVFAARASFMRVATVDAVADQRHFVASAELSGFAEGWFDEGVLTFESGNNTGASYEIKSWAEAGRALELWEAVRLEVQAGDQLRLHPGCHKRLLEACRERFVIPDSRDFASGNVGNFRGEPCVPGGGFEAITPDAAGA